MAVAVAASEACEDGNPLAQDPNGPTEEGAKRAPAVDVVDGFTMGLGSDERLPAATGTGWEGPDAEADACDWRMRKGPPEVLGIVGGLAAGAASVGRA